MTRILFLCPPAGKINGGVKYIFRMAETLRQSGHEAIVLEKDGARPRWFKSTAPIVAAAALQPRKDEILVLPEDQPDILRQLADWPQRKVIYCQNHFYAAIGAQGARSFRDFGVHDILCSSRTILDYCQARHPDVRLHAIPCAVDPALFKPGIKTRSLALMPRKRPVEAMFLQDMMLASSRAWRDFEWISLHEADEKKVAETLGRAAIFLSLSRLDGFGLTPVEAMASGCIVAGFTGIGGRDYATPQNGFWAGEDDFFACRDALEQARRLLDQGTDALHRYQSEAAATAARYTPEVFAEAAGRAWTTIISSA